MYLRPGVEQLLTRGGRAPRIFSLCVSFFISVAATRYEVGGKLLVVVVEWVDPQDSSA